MAEPVSTAAAAAVAAPAVAAAAPAASSAAPAAGSGAGAGGAGASGAGANSPAYSLKSQGSPLDSVGAQPTSGLDTSSMQRTLGCHDCYSTMPKSISPQTPGEMPNIADHFFLGSRQHWQIHLPQIEQPGHQALRQPDTLPGESLREPSAFDRAQSSSRPAETPDPVGPRPEQRATTNPETQPDQSGASQAGNTSQTATPEPSAQDFAQSSEPSAPPKAAEHPTEPTPEDAATAPKPSHVPDRSPGTSSATPDDQPLIPESSGSIGDKIDMEVEEFFSEGKRSNETLKDQIDDYVSEGGDPILATLGATGIDLLGGAMDFAEGSIRAIIDTRNLGEGVKNGTLEGLQDDAGRLLNILPQGRAARAVSNVLTFLDAVDAIKQDPSATINQGGVGSALGPFPTSRLFNKLRVRGKGGRRKHGKYTKRELPKLQRKWIKERVKELREQRFNGKRHSDESIRETIRGQIHAAKLDNEAKTYNQLIERFLRD